MTKAVSKCISLPEDLIHKIETSADAQHKKFSEWMRDAALEKLGPLTEATAPTQTRKTIYRKGPRT